MASGLSYTPDEYMNLTHGQRDAIITIVNRR